MHPPESKLDALMRQQIERYPVLHIEDAYKLVYQGTLGIEHLLTDTLAAKNYLEQEWRAIPAVDDEPVYDIISPDSQWVRLHLKRYKAAGGNTDAVWRAMLRSAKTGDRKIFMQRWQEFMSLVDEQRLPFDRDELLAFDRQMTQAGYPAIHHSSAYREAYQPAYRILLIDEARRLAEAVSAKNPL